ncbi:MAG TPA: hypothetical protein VM165_21690 [Planctomycetaceae bacterium]|nr:hypothetical protein [Planctomycetaceae bacterium]
MAIDFAAGLAAGRSGCHSSGTTVSPQPSSRDMIVLITRDVFFASKITGTAAMLGLKTITVSGCEQIAESAADNDITGLILDLGSGVSPEQAIQSFPAALQDRTIAFGAHVDRQALAAAEQAGFRTVLPRSRFSAELPQLLRELSASDGRASDPDA